jgi:hypothetical protein
MSFVRPEVTDKGCERPARVGDGFIAMPARTVNSGAGAQTISLAQILGGVAVFTGAAGAVTYTTDTAANILAAMPAMDIGDTYMFVLSNTAAQTATIAGGTGVTASGNLTVNATAKMFLLEKTSATTMNLYGL